MRADFRGFGYISAYQKMGMISVLYIFGLVSFVHYVPSVDPEILEGIGVLWDPFVIIGLQLLWLVFFLTFGRSSVTTSTIFFDLVRENV